VPARHPVLRFQCNTIAPQNNCVLDQAQTDRQLF